MIIIILDDSFSGDTKYIALDANNIARVEDEGNIVSISGNIFLYPPQGHPILYKYCPGNIFFNIARTLCDQSFNIDLRLRYVVRIHSSENRAMPCPP